VIRFIDEYQDRRSGELRWGIEPIAKVLGIAPSTYHAAKKRPLSARSVRDAELRPQVLRVWELNLAVYGADKVWDQLNKDGVRVARCTVERLMADMGLRGCRRGRVWVRTTEGDDRLVRPADLVERQFRAPAPNRLWVADLTYVKTHSGWVYVAFIVDVFSRMVVGWQASRSLRSDLAIDALEMAVHNRRRAGADLSHLVHHSDRGVQGGFRGSSQHLDVEVVRHGVQARASAGDPRDAGEDVVAGSAVDREARGPGPLLASDRSRSVDRGCRDGGGRGIRGWVEVVPSGWRDVTNFHDPCVGPLLVLRRTRGDSDPARAASWCARDRTTNRPRSIDDLARAAPQRVDA
jgi:putative transposase